jgi:MFS family permease
MNTERILFINILLIACLSGIATDIYAPSLAAIAHLMHAPVEKAQLSLTIFMVGLALSQLLYGPMSEGVGRQLPSSIRLDLLSHCSGLHGIGRFY